MIRILLCGEGPGDVGQKQVWDRNTREVVSVEGWLQPLVRRLLKGRVSFDIRSRRELVLFPRERSKHRPLPEGHGAKALIAKLIATTEEFDAVIFMVDADTNDKAEWRDKREEIHNGFARINSAVRPVACVPKCASESWLLADPNAWSQLGLEDMSFLPDRPENAWGDRADPEGKHPHQSFARACKQAGLADNRETRVALAATIGIAVLSDRCPLSFGAFNAELTRTPIRGRDCNCGDECCA